MTCRSMFIATLFVIVPSCKQQKHPPTLINNWMDNWYIHAVEWYRGIKRATDICHSMDESQKNLLSEINQSKEYLLHDSSYIYLRKCKLIYRDREQISCLAEKLGVWGKEGRKKKSTFEDEGQVHYRAYSDGFQGVQMSTTFNFWKLSILNMYSLICQLYTLIMH
jgi:hypothetical protein